MHNRSPRGTLAGGALGAGTGAIIGAATGAPGAGAAIGGALGAVAGALTSDQLQAQDNLLAAQQQDIYRMREQIYRQRLETYLQKRFDDQDWEMMIDLGNLVEALRRTCLAAFFSRHGDNPEWRKSAKAEAMQKVQRAHKALRWL